MHSDWPQEISKAEEAWSAESSELKQIIQRLITENIQLARALNSASAPVDASSPSYSQGIFDSFALVLLLTVAAV